MIRRQRDSRAEYQLAKILDAVMMSPPTKLGLRAANCIVVLTVWLMTRSRNPGANRSIWATMAAVASPM